MGDPPSQNAALHNPHEPAEAWSLCLHSAIADRLEAEPERVLSIAREKLAELTASPSHRSSMPYFRRWEQLLGGPLDALLSTMRAPDQEAIVLRQASPFTGVITSGERSRLFHQWRARRVQEGKDSPAPTRGQGSDRLWMLLGGLDDALAGAVPEGRSFDLLLLGGAAVDVCPDSPTQVRGAGYLEDYGVHLVDTKGLNLPAEFKDRIVRWEMPLFPAIWRTAPK